MVPTMAQACTIISGIASCNRLLNSLSPPQLTLPRGSAPHREGRSPWQAPPVPASGPPVGAGREALTGCLEASKEEVVASCGEGPGLSWQHSTTRGAGSHQTGPRWQSHHRKSLSRLGRKSQKPCFQPQVINILPPS